MEEIEMDRLPAAARQRCRRSRREDLAIMGWDIPEVDEDRARSLIVARMKAAIERPRGRRELS